MRRKAKPSPPMTAGDLIEAVSRGRMTPAEAEKAADENGLSPLLNSPDPAAFDPISEPIWTLPMALAWIMTRQADCVREMWDRWRSEKEFWWPSFWKEKPDGPVCGGYWIKTEHPAGLIDLSACQDTWLNEHQLWLDEGRRAGSWSEAAAEFLNALRAGTIEATGIASLGAARTPIPAFKWQDLEFYNAADGRMAAREMKGLGAGFDHVTVESKVVRELWPHPLPRLIPSDEILCPVPSLEGSGHLPLSQAAYWIATKGGSESIKPDPAIWRPAFDALLRRIASKEIKSFGRKNGQGPAEKIDAHVFSDICVAYPNCAGQMDVYSGKDPYLRCYLAPNEDEWRKTFNDALMCQHKVLWSHLQVRKSDIKRFWTFHQSVRLKNKSETEAIQVLAAALRMDNQLTRAAAKELCPNVSGDAFRHRVWPRAREKAQLTAAAPAGRKRRQA